MKTICVVIPTYNSEKYIKKCLNSIYNQTFKDAQIIVVNDCSTDKTKEILNEYADIFRGTSFDYIVVHLTKNQGQAACFNFALPLVKSKYFMWLDSDDFLYEDCFSKKIQFMEANLNVDVSICKAEVFIFPNYETPVKVLEKCNKDSDYFNDLLVAKDVIWVPGSFCVRTDYLFERIPRKYIYPSRQGQNVQLQLPIMYKAKYSYIDCALYGVTSHNDSHSRRNLSHTCWIKRQKEIHIIYKKTLKNMNINFAERKKALKINKNNIYNKIFLYCIKNKLIFRSIKYFFAMGLKKPKEAL